MPATYGSRTMTAERRRRGLDSVWPSSTERANLLGYGDPATDTEPLRVRREQNFVGCANPGFRNWQGRVAAERPRALRRGGRIRERSRPKAEPLSVVALRDAISPVFRLPLRVSTHVPPSQRHLRSPSLRIGEIQETRTRAGHTAHKALNSGGVSRLPHGFLEPDQSARLDALDALARHL